MPALAFFSSLSDFVGCLASLSIQLFNEMALRNTTGSHDFDVSALVRHAATSALLANCVFSLFQVLNYSPTSYTTTPTTFESIETTKPIASRKSKKERRRRIIEESDEEEDVT
jgi:hypothetical protein